MKLTIFDLDNTILNGDSDYSWIEFLIKNNYVDAKSYEEKNKYFFYLTFGSSILFLRSDKHLICDNSNKCVDSKKIKF